jgi:hypothetical protein
MNTFEDNQKAGRPLTAWRGIRKGDDDISRPERTSDIYSIAQNNKATATNHTPLTEADNASPRWDSVEAVLATQKRCREIAEMSDEEFDALTQRMSHPAYTTVWSKGPGTREGNAPRKHWKDCTEEEKQGRIDRALEAFATDDSEEPTAEELL